MQNQLNAKFIVDTLKKAIIWKKGMEINTRKLSLNVLIDYIRQRFVENNELAQNAFLSFYNNPMDFRLAGKLETWIEISLRDKIDTLDDLLTIIENVENFKADNLPKTKKDAAKNISEKTNDDLDKLSFDDINQANETNIKRPIIVPWDFSDVANFALNHALMHSKKTNEGIILLHITANDKDINSAYTKMSKIVDKIAQKSGIKPRFMVETGNILKTITQIANDKNARFVIMGTHGILGMQKFTGSLALKVITGTLQPFIIVQKNPVQNTITNIALPIDNRRESKQQLKQVLMLAKFYNIKYVITMPEEISNASIKKSMTQNLNFTTKFMNQQNIQYDVAYIKGTNNFADAALKYAEKHLPDMIIILTTTNNNIQDYVLGAEEQKIIANSSKVPVMCVNPMKAKYSRF